MTQQGQFREPRTAVIFRTTVEAIRNSHHTDASFAQAVADQYMDQVAPDERVVQFHVGTDTASIVTAGKRNAKIIERFRNGTVKLPADLEEAWVAALPEPWRTDCARALAQRYGFMGARAPAEGVAAQMLCTGQMAIEFGQAIQAVGEVQAGVQGIHDPARLRRALKETADLLGELATLRATLQGQLEGASAGPRAVPAPGARA